MRTTLSLAVLCGALAACQRPAAPEPAAPAAAAATSDTAPAGAPPSAAPAPSPEAPAPAPAPNPPLPLGPAVAVEPTGPLALTPGSENVVDPAARFEVEVAAPLPDARLVLLDAGDAHVPADGTREVARASTRFTLAPSSPLVPASRYLLRIEGSSGREPRDAGGQAYLPASIEVLAAGAPPPPPEPAKRRRRR